MSTPNFVITANDSGRSLAASLQKLDGTPVDLSSAISVSLKAHDMATGVPQIDSPVDIVDAPNGKIRYDFSTLDTAVAGDYAFTFEVRFPQGISTYPTEGPLWLRILGDDDTPSFVSSEYVFAVTGKMPILNAIRTATMLIGMAIDRDLTDTVWLDTLTADDTRRLRQAIAYESVNVKDIDMLPGTTSMTNGDVSVSFNADMLWGHELSALTERMLSHLSWRVPRRTLVPVKQKVKVRHEPRYVLGSPNSGDIT